MALCRLQQADTCI